jgi:hypothetical protein
MLAMVIGAVVMMLNAGTARAYHVEPIVYTGNPDCADLGYAYGFKLDFAPENKSYPIDGFHQVTIANTNGTFFDWSSDLGMDAVIVKGGTKSNVYVYDPESYGDTGLHPPVNASGGYAGISHIEFCFDYELTVTKTADTSYTRTYQWSIDKSVTPASWDLFTGDSGTSQYSVVVNRTGYTDSGWAVSGTISVKNNTPLAATVTGVSDEISGFGAVAVDCGASFPITLAAGAELSCTYSSALPNGDSRTNTATATTSGAVGGDSGSADVIFGDPTNVVNDTINVSDTYAGSLGSASGYAEFTYSRTFRCDDDEGTHGNTATIVETGQSDSADVTVNCYSLDVSKTAVTSFERKWSWTIDKSVDRSSLLLSTGQTAMVNYTVVVNASSKDQNYAVAGTITVHNPAPIAATINSVSDVVSGAGAADVTCPDVSFPYELAADGTLTCSYTKALDNANSTTNTATATLQNHAYAWDGSSTANGSTDFTGTAAVTFSGTSPNIIDECVTVSDSYAGVLGTVCASATNKPFSFSYSRDIGPYATCGDYTVENTAAFITNDTGATGQDNATVLVSVPCNTGCTLTLGYWKTHSKYGPARYDETWAQIGEDTGFYSSGKSYYQVLWTAPQGNAYYILAHQYIAAKLNILNGASATPEVNAAISWAETQFFNLYSPSSTLSKSVKNQATTYATLLNNYNNGVVGPGHCSE